MHLARFSGTWKGDKSQMWCATCVMNDR